jgi:polysaccharide biosynthesis protein PslG
MEKHHQYTGGKEVRLAPCKGPIRLALAALLLSGCGTPGLSPTPSSDGFTKPISFAILEDYDKGTDLYRVAEDFELFRRLGITTWRGSFGWDDYEPEPGHLDLEWLERFVGLADSMGIELRPYLGYTPAWAARGGEDEHAWNDPPEQVEAWEQFVDTLASRLKSHPSVRSYEIYNEENVPLWWEGTSQEYASVLRSGAAAIRRSDPDAQVLLGGLVGPDAGWLDSACDDGQAPFDVLPFHAYPETWTPDSVTVENYLGSGYEKNFLPLADQECGRRPIWLNEVGFATTPGKTERQQAEWWVRAFATFLAVPRVEHIGVYEIRDQLQETPAVGDAPNYYLGLVRTDGTRKLAFDTVKLLVGLFGTDSITVADRELRVRVTDGRAGELYHHLFIRPDRRQLVFVWDRGGDPTVDLELRRAGNRVIAYDLDGSATPWEDTDGRVIRGVKLAGGGVRVFEVE